MTNYDSFHCRIDISRNLPNNITGNDTLHNTLNYFFDHTPTPFISIGSAKKSSVIVEGISEKHCTFNFQHNSMVIKSFDSTVIKSDTGNAILEKDDIFTLQFTEIKDIMSHTLLKWTIEIRPHVVIRVVVSREEDYAKSDIEEYLVKKYGAAKKISESESYLIYKVDSNSVVKILHPYHKEEELQVLEFFKVARQVAAIDSDTVCDIKSFDKTLPHVKMDFFPGQTLQNYLAKKGKLSYPEAVVVLRRLNRLLRATKKADYICKNLNLDNVLCGIDKSMKFTGWNTTLDGILLNSRYALYLAPEYLRAEKVTTSADMYSVGIIFYRLITGRFPFKSVEDYQQRVANNISITSEELKSNSVYITPQTSIILEQMLAFNPEERATLSDLESWLLNVSDFRLWENVLKMDKAKIHFGLQIETSPQPIHGQICPLKNNQSFVIGRQADINIPGDNHISRQHTKIILENGVCTVEDLGSSNGTKIMGERIKKCQIDSGVSFKIGQTTLAFYNYRTLKNERKKLMVPNTFNASGWQDLANISQIGHVDT